MDIFELEQKAVNVELYLCKPDRTIVARLDDVFGVKYSFKLGSINELEFNVPTHIDINNELVRNPYFDTIRDRYLVKFVLPELNYEEWYTIRTPEDSMNEDVDYKKIVCFSLGYELNDKRLRSYTVTSRTLNEILAGATSGLAGETLDGILKETTWTVGYVDASVIFQDSVELRRFFDFTSGTVLDALFKVCETFKCIVVFDTVNKKLNFYNPSNYGEDKGFIFSYDKYINSLNYKKDNDNFCTRLYGYGKDGLTFNKVNVTGQSYIDDYTFLFGSFERDENKNVIKHSEWMSDDLCNGLLDYQEFLQTKEGEFQALLNQRKNYEAQYTAKSNEVTNAKIDYNIAYDNYVVAQHAGQPLDELKAILDFKEAILTQKQNELEQIQTNIDAVDADILALRNELAIENFLTTQQLTQLKDFIVVKYYENQYCDNEEELFRLTKLEMEKLRTPPVDIKINVIDFYQCIDPECIYDRKEVKLGDNIIIQHKNLNINVKAKIIEITHDIDSGDLNIQIANAHDIENDKDNFINKLNKSYSSSLTIDVSKYKWDGVVDVKNDFYDFFNNAIDTSLHEIKGAVNESVIIGRQGIIVTDPNEPLKALRIVHGNIGITSDGFNTLGVAITGDGVIANNLIGAAIASSKLTITNTAGNFLVNGDGVTIQDMNLIITRTDRKSRIVGNATDGLKIQSSTDGINFTDKFYADTSGKVVADDLVANRLIVKSGGDVLIDANTRTIDFTKFTTKLGQVTVNNIPLSDVISSINTGSYGQLTANSISAGAITASKISVSNLSAISANLGTITAGNITGVTITGATIRTASSGDRIEITGTGFECLTSTATKHGWTLNSGNFSSFDCFYYGEQRASIDVSSGNLWVIGKMAQVIIDSNNSNIQIRPGSYYGGYGETIFYGDVNFSNANVSGITAKFA